MSMRAFLPASFAASVVLFAASLPALVASLAAPFAAPVASFTGSLGACANAPGVAIAPTANSNAIRTATSRLMPASLRTRERLQTGTPRLQEGCRQPQGDRARAGGRGRRVTRWPPGIQVSRSDLGARF